MTNEPNSPSGRYGARLGRASTAEALQERLIAQELATLDGSLRGVRDDGSLVRAAQLVVAARRRIVTGAGKSYPLAHLLSLDLATALSQVSVLDAASGRGVDQLSDVRDSDVLIAIGLRRYRRETIALAEVFAERGGTVVALTDAIDSPLAAPAAATVVVDTASASHVISATAVVSAGHLLTTLSAASAKGARRRLAQREEILARLDGEPGDRRPADPTRSPR